MLIIPVIDIKQGIAVHAIQGNREKYQALESELVASSDPEAICHSLMQYEQIQQIYVADLDAIMGNDHQHALIHRLIQDHTDLVIWLDSGRSFYTDHYTESDRVQQILGTEMQFSLNDLQTYVQQKPRTILSLDFDHQGFMGDERILEHPEVWPEHVILMDLTRVGSHAGPDNAKVQQIQEQLSPQQQLYVAGGIRDEKDLEILKQRQIAGVLLASALHTKKISLQ